MELEIKMDEIRQAPEIQSSENGHITVRPDPKVKLDGSQLDVSIHCLNCYQVS